MSMDDPGWGGYTPPPPGQSTGSPPMGVPPGASGSAATRTRTLLVAGGVVLFLIVAVIVVAVATSGGSKASSSQAQPPPASDTTAPAAAGISKADYITRADAICLSFRSQLQSATAAGNLQVAAQVAQSELDELRNLPDPVADVDLIRTFINEGTQAVNWLNQSDIPDFNTAILAADTAAGKFGMKVCNYGH